MFYSYNVNMQYIKCCGPGLDSNPCPRLNKWKWKYCIRFSEVTMTYIKPSKRVAWDVIQS